MSAEIIPITKPLNSEGSEFKNFLEEVYANALLGAFVVKKKGSSDYYIYCSEETKIQQFKILLRLKDAIEEIVRYYPEEEEDDNEVKEVGEMPPLELVPGTEDN